MAEYNSILDDLNAALVFFDASKPYRYKPKTKLPALSPQMQAAFDAEAEMVAKVLRRAREIDAELLTARAEIERLKTRVGWLDHLDTEEGRKLHANEALLVEIERLKAELAKAKEAT